MSEFRIEKVKRSLEVVLSNGHKMSGTIFLEPVARHHAGEQDTRELLNDDDEFFPISVNGQLTLLAKDQLRTATYRAPRDLTKPARAIAVKVILTDGAVITGSVELEARTDADRLLDYLNGLTGRFLALAVDGGATCLVNRRMIAGVQQR